MSAKVYLGEACGDENGKSSGGLPGNQNGRELRITKWYLSKKGWNVLRPESSKTAVLISDNARAACSNPNIGYDQSDRNTLYTVASKVGFDCSKVTTPCECDCSALVRVCVAYAGIRVRNFSTASEVERLMDTGKFELIEDGPCTTNPDYLRAGDILVTKVKGHTAVVLNDGSKAFKDEYVAQIGSGPANGSASAPLYSGTEGKFIFTRVLKYGVKGDDVKKLKELLAESGYTGLNLNNPNYRSKTTSVVKRYQKDHGLVVDGKAGKATITSLGGIYN